MLTFLKQNIGLIAENRLIRFARETPGGNNDVTHDVAKNSMDVLNEQITPNGLNDFASRLVESSVFNAINFRSQLTGRLKHREEGMSAMNMVSGIAKDGIDSLIDIGTDVVRPYVGEVGARIGEQRGRDATPLFKDTAGEYGKNIGRTMGIEGAAKGSEMIKGLAGGVIDSTVETGSKIAESGISAVASFLR